MKSLRKLLLCVVSLAGLAALQAVPAWAAYPVAFPGADDQEVIDSVAGPSGAVYVVGTFQGDISSGSGSEVHGAVGSDDVFAAKLSPYGDVIWLTTGGGASKDQGLVIALDKAENVYIGGIYHDDAKFGSQFGSQVLPEHGNGRGDIFVVKLAGADGELLWAARASGEGYDLIKGLVFIPSDPSVAPPTPDVILLGGSYQCNLAFYDQDGDLSTKAPRVDGSVDCDGEYIDVADRRLPLAAAISTTGSWQWRFVEAKTLSSNPEDNVGAEIQGLVADPLGMDIYAYGRIREQVTFYNHDGVPTAFPTEPTLGMSTGSFSGPKWRLDSSKYYSSNYSAHIPANEGETSNSVLLIPDEITLTPDQSVELEFRHAADLGAKITSTSTSCYSRVHVKIDDEPWEVVGGSHYTSGAPDCHGPVVNSVPDSFCGQSPNWPDFNLVRLRFANDTSSSRVYQFRLSATCDASDDGWWVDNIELAKIFTNGTTRVDIGAYTFPNNDAGFDRHFVARIDAAEKKWSWVKLVPDGLVPRNITIDRNQNLVLVGDKGAGTISFGEHGINLPTAAGAFIAEMASDDAWLWAKSTVGGQGYGVYSDAGGDNFLAGRFNSTFGRDTGAPVLTTAGGRDIFIARLDDSGDFYPGGPADPWGDELSAVRAGGVQNDYVNTITGSGTQLYVGGRFQGISKFGDVSLTATNLYDGVVASLDTAGNFPKPSDERWMVGEPIPAPAGADLSLTAVPDLRLAGQEFGAFTTYFKWSLNDAGKYDLIPIKELEPVPVELLEIRWKVDGQPPESGERISTKGLPKWPGVKCDDAVLSGCYQRHLVGAPVDIRPPATTQRTYLELHKQSISNATVVGQAHFKSTSPETYSTIVYTQEDPRKFDVKVVKTVSPVNGFRDTTCTIGSPIVLNPVDHNQPEKSGYVMNESAFYDAGSYDRQARTGQIVPVNRVNTNRSADDDKRMLVALYKLNDIEVAWPHEAVEYDCQWPTTTPALKRIIIASEQGSEVLGQPTLDPVNFPQIHIYNQPDVSLPGYNPNDEHAFFKPSNTNQPNLAIFALRSDFGSGLEGDIDAASDPYVIAKYFDEALQLWKHVVYKVEAVGGGFGAFSYSGFAGRTVEPPYPVRLLPRCSQTQVVGEEPKYLPIPFYRDKNSQLWARAAGSGAVRYHYPMQPDFFYDLGNDDVNDGSGCIPWMARLPPAAGGTAGDSTPIEVAYDIAWPTEVPLLMVGETLLKPKRGLPDIYDQAAIEVVYGEKRAQLIDPLGVRQITLLELPQDDLAISIDDLGRTVITGNASGTQRLPYSLYSRLRWDPLTQKLRFSGVFDESGAGDPLLLLNVMTVSERNRLRELSNDSDWDDAIDKLFALSRNPNGVKKICTNEVGRECLATRPVNPVTDVLIGVKDDDNDGILGQFQAEGIHAALTAGASEGTGYMTLAFNDSRTLALPVSLEVIQVGCLTYPEPPLPPTLTSPYIGQINVIGARNVFDEQVTLRHSGDFGGRTEDLEFEWFEHPDVDGTPPPPPDIEGGTLGGWQQIPGADEVQITIGGANIKTLSDNWYFARYKGLPACNNDTEWTVPAGQPGSIPTDLRAQFSAGWVKRVVAGLNPFDARVAAFHSAATNTFASMVAQLGERYEGPIALSDDPANLNGIGLIEAYETVFRRAQQLSIDSTPPVSYEPANAALLNIASRIADFYMLLGNEAYADAEDPTIGITTDSGQFGFGSLAPTIFNFQNQSASLLEEELILLRGRDDRQGPVAANPVYNRYFWNFTQGDGEVAYALSYNISDQNADGFVNEFDARIQYPQGHGDAWGHYLTAATTYYQLLRHPYFGWNPRPEAVQVAGVPLQVDYLDERKFARIAAARARTGAQIVDLTYRSLYVEDPAGQWQGYSDTIAERAWGLSEWGRRVGQGAYLDWMVGTSLLPEIDPNPAHVGIQRIDRKSIHDLDEIVAAFAAVQSQVDEADRGLNPLGAAKGVVPFDIDPARVDAGETHFEQIYDRAQVALENAVQVWDFANNLNRMLRFNQDEVDDLTLNSKDRELDFRNRLIEIFGSPYPEDLGPGGTYPADYTGPDMYHYGYVDAPALNGTPFEIDELGQPDRPNQIGRVREFTADFDALPGVGFFDFDAEDQSSDCTTNPFGDGCSLGDPPSTKLKVKYLTWELPVLSSYAMIKPPQWRGVRPAAGRIQEAFDEILNAQIATHRALAEYEKLRLDLKDAEEGLKAVFNLRNESLRIKNSERRELAVLTTVVQTMNTAAITLRRVSAAVSTSFETTEECLPTSTIAGVAAGGDLTSAGRCAIEAASSGVSFGLDTAADAVDIAQSITESAKEDVSLQAAIELDILSFREELDGEVGKIEEMLRQEPLLRNEIYSRAQVVEQAKQNYRDALAEGLRTLQELVTFRRNTAAAVQEYRYQDMAFRVFRNDALQKYRAAFDLAARFTYLAATAYDYDTNLIGSNGNSGRAFLTDIVRQRSLGQILNGVPVPGSPGLANPLGSMAANFTVLKTQMGFNNPQIETNRFSLRSNLFRLDPDAEATADWRSELLRYRVDNLWDVPEFRRYVRPFTEEALGPQPGLVIPFSTTVTFGLNFFGWPLAAGDSAYDPSQFSTRVRSVGVWFDGYGELPLSITPRVYLVPVGADILRPPTSGEFTTREWSVVDQLIPVPYDLGAGELANPDWRPLDTLSGGFTETRRFGSFRAHDYDPNAPFGDQTTADSRLIGRSVWNTRWLLIIPGGTLLFDPEEGIDTFIGNGTEPGVSDILIFFKTYAYQGF